MLSGHRSMFGQWMGQSGRAKEVMTQMRPSTNERLALVNKYPRFISLSGSTVRGAPQIFLRKHRAVSSAAHSTNLLKITFLGFFHILVLVKENRIEKKK